MATCRGCERKSLFSYLLAPLVVWGLNEMMTHFGLSQIPQESETSRPSHPPADLGADGQMVRKTSNEISGQARKGQGCVGREGEQWRAEGRGSAIQALGSAGHEAPTTRAQVSPSWIG